MITVINNKYQGVPITPPTRLEEIEQECVNGWFQGLDIHENASYLIRKFVKLPNDLETALKELDEVFQILLMIYKDGECK